MWPSQSSDLNVTEHFTCLGGHWKQATTAGCIVKAREVN